MVRVALHSIHLMRTPENIGRGRRLGRGRGPDNTAPQAVRSSASASELGPTVVVASAPSSKVFAKAVDLLHRQQEQAREEYQCRPPIHKLSFRAFYY